MDEPQPMFRTDLKPLRNKDGQCDKCYKYPEEGQPRFAACAACKMALYCSKECQRGDWEKHRYACDVISHVLVSISKAFLARIARQASVRGHWQYRPDTTLQMHDYTRTAS